MTKGKILEFDATALRRQQMANRSAGLAAPETKINTPTKPTASEPVAQTKVGSAALSDDDVTKIESFLINFVVEQTGYPEDWVNLDADLEGDINIDSIKKAQMFGEIAEKYDVNIKTDVSLDDFTTLRHILDYLKVNAKNRTDNTTAVTVETVSRIPEILESKTNVDFNDEGLKKYLKDFVIEQTGYPEEMVDFDADLEGDLGIDSIKKAQLFGEISENYDVTIEENTSLDDFETLNHILMYLSKNARKHSDSKDIVTNNTTADNSVLLAPSHPETKTVSATKEASFDLASLKTLLVNFVIEHTGYPAEMVELDADLEGDLGIDSIKKAQLFGELSEQFVITASKADMSLDDFSTLRHILDYIHEHAKPR